MTQKGYTTVTIREQTYEKIKNEAKRKGVSAGKLVTDCIDHYLMEAEITQ
jgi:hypothetical protein